MRALSRQNSLLPPSLSPFKRKRACCEVEKSTRAAIKNHTILKSCSEGKSGHKVVGDRSGAKSITLLF